MEKPGLPVIQPSPLLTNAEVAAWLRVKESTLRKWVCYNQIPHLKVGRLVSFRREDIERWLADRNPQNKSWLERLNAIEESYNEAVR